MGLRDCHEKAIPSKHTPPTVPESVFGPNVPCTVIGKSERIPDPHSSSPIEYSAVFLCPGAELRLARPIFKRRFRIQLELPAVHLQDLVQRDSFGGAEVSIDLRTPM